MNSLELVESFSEFKDLKNIDRTTMQHVLEDVFRAMLKKKFNTDEHIDVIVNIDKMGGDDGSDGFLRHREAVRGSGRQERSLGADRRRCFLGAFPAPARGGLAHAAGGAEVEGGSQAVGCACDVQGDRALRALQPIGRPGGVPASRPSFLHSVPGVGARGPGSGRQDGVALSGAVGAGRSGGEAVRRVRRRLEGAGLAGDGRSDRRRLDRAGAEAAQRAGRERDDQGGRDAGGLGEAAGQACPEGHRRTLDQEARQEPFRLQEPCERGPAAQAGAALPCDGRGGARQPGGGCDPGWGQHGVGRVGGQRLPVRRDRGEAEGQGSEEPDPSQGAPQPAAERAGEAGQSDALEGAGTGRACLRRPEQRHGRAACAGHRAGAGEGPHRPQEPGLQHAPAGAVGAHGGGAGMRAIRGEESARTRRNRPSQGGKPPGNRGNRQTQGRDMPLDAYLARP